MKRSWILALFVVVALIQLAVPGYTIWRQERTLAFGQAFKFRTEPVDPYDAFRGRFVALAFRDVYPRSLEAGLSPEDGKTVYATVEVGADGFATFAEAAASPPADRPYLKARWGFDGRLVLPFDRYYLDEFKAPEAERTYRENAKREDSYLVVRLLGGNWAIEDLYVGGRPLREALDAPAR